MKTGKPGKIADKKKNYKIFIVLAAVVILAMLAASCGAGGTPGSGAAGTTGSGAQGGAGDPPGSGAADEDRGFPDRKPPVDDPDNPGGLTSFYYSFGAFTGGDYKYNIDVRDGNAYFRTNVAGENPLNVEGSVGMSVLEDITGILQKYGVFEWDGFSRYDSEVSDGYSFHLSAVFGERELIAAGYMKYPENYYEAHEALAGYLEQLTVCVEKPETVYRITDFSEIKQVSISLGQRLGAWVSISISDPGVYIYYTDANTKKGYSLDDIGQEKFEMFIDFVCDFFDEYKDSSGMEGLETESGRDRVSLEIAAVSKESGKELHYDVVLDTVRNKEGCDELTDMTLWLVG